MKDFQKLSRDEMKNVKGGVAMVTCTFTGTCTNLSSASYDPSDTTAATIQQAICDTICEKADCCDNVDCPGAVGD